MLAVLAAVLLLAPAPAARLAGVTSGLAAVAALHGALRHGRATHLLPLGSGWSVAGRPLPAPLVAEYCGPHRIVLRGAPGRIVVWRDAVDPTVFRRLAVAARWPGRAAER